MFYECHVVNVRKFVSDILACVARLHLIRLSFVLINTINIIFIYTIYII